MSRPSLTDFDREVLAVLIASGGWNALARQRLGGVAARYGISSAGLSRVVAGVAAAARDGRLQQAMAALSRPTRSAPMPRARAATPAAGDGAAGGPPTGSIADAGTGLESMAAPSAMSRNDAILLGVVSGLLLVSTALAIILVVRIWNFVDGRRAGGAERDDAARAPDRRSPPSTGEGDRSPAPLTPGPGSDSRSPQSSSTGWTRDDSASQGRGDGAAASRPVAPSPGGRPSAGSPSRPAAVPVSYPRVPGFKAALSSLELDQALAQARGAAVALESIANEAPNDRAAMRSWSDAQRAIGASWPRLDAVTRRALLERTMALLRRADDSATAELLIEPFRADLGAAPASPAAIRRGAWAAGVLGSLLSEPGLAPEVVTVIAALRLAPAEGAGDAFDRFAASWLDAQLPALAGQGLAGAPQDDFDRAEAWIEAQSQVRSAAEVQDAWLRAIETLLHVPLRFDLPGTASDLLGRFASLVEWRAGTSGAAIAGRRLARWMNDSTLPAPRLWAFGSIMLQGRMAPWFDASMVVPERATMADREAALARMLAAIGPSVPDAVALSRVPGEFVQRWRALASPVLESADEKRLVAPGVSIASLLRTADSSASSRALLGAERLLRLSELSAAGSLLLAGRSGEAAQRLSEIENAASRPVLAGLGPGGRSLPTPAEPSGDGLLGRRLDDARMPQDRVEIIRRRRAEAALDLGPLDAARLVREAYQGEPSTLRLTAQGVIVDSFASGRRVAQELVDQFVLTGGADAALARFVERITGERLPPHPNPGFRAKAMAALLRHRLRLSEHPWHAVDALLERMAASESIRLDAEGGAPEPFRDSVDPGEPITALGDLLRARAGARIALQPFPASLEALDRRDEARRALADGGGQRLVASLWRVLELEAFLAAADRPSLLPALQDALAKAQAESTAAKGAIDQAGAIERARVALLGLRLDAESGGGT